MESALLGSRLWVGGQVGGAAGKACCNRVVEAVYVCVGGWRVCVGGGGERANHVITWTCERTWSQGGAPHSSSSITTTTTTAHHQLVLLWRRSRLVRRAAVGVGRRPLLATSDAPPVCAASPLQTSMQIIKSFCLTPSCSPNPLHPLTWGHPPAGSHNPPDQHHHHHHHPLLLLLLLLLLRPPMPLPPPAAAQGCTAGSGKVPQQLS
jgi:hypothetical protein